MPGGSGRCPNFADELVAPDGKPCPSTQSSVAPGDVRTDSPLRLKCDFDQFKHGSSSIDVRLLANNIPEGKIKVTITYPNAQDLPDRKPVVEWIRSMMVSQPLPV